jgi:predicted membrane protein
METLENERSHTSNARIVIGLVLLTLAALIFADNFDLFDWNWRRVVFSFPMLVLVIGLVSLAKNESRLTGIVLVAVGGFFLVAKIYYFPMPIRHLFWPTLLAVFGVLLLVKHKSHWNPAPFRKGALTEDFIDDVVIFGGTDQKVRSKNFQGGRITNIFGGSNFDMLDASLAPGSNTLDVFFMFGGSKLIVPADWKVRIEVAAIFGGFSDKRKSITTTESTGSAELVVKGVAIFGGGEVKNY